MAGQSSAYGWSPLGQRQLDEYSSSNLGARPAEPGGAGRWAKTWQELRSLPSMASLAQLAVRHMCLLHAVDAFPRGGLCQGRQLKEALRRYERLWLPLIAEQHAAAGGAHGYASLVPPLDVAFFWHLHRLQPEAYEKDCAELKSSDGRRPPVLHVGPEQAFAFSDGSCQAGAATAALWRAAHPSEPFWPPPAPGSSTDAFRSRLSADLAAVAVRVPVFTHQLLRAAYLQLPFLNRAVDRYCKFLLLRKHHLELQHPIAPLDVTLMWTSHMSVSGAYAAECTNTLQRVFLDLPGASASPWIERDASGSWRFHWTDTARAWLDEFEEPFVVPGSGYVPMDSQHPAESRLSPQLLAAFEEGSSDKGSSWRAGAHALYLWWLRNPNLRQRQQQQHQQQPEAAPPPPPAPVVRQAPQQQQQQQKKKSSSGFFACLGCGGADADDEDRLQVAAAAAAAPAPPPPPTVPAKPAVLPLLQEAELRRIAAGFSSFKHLPLSASHPYWAQLTPVGPDVSADVPAEPGTEVELFSAAAAAPAGAALNGSRQDVAARPGDQQVLTGDYEVAVAGGVPALLW